MKTTVRNVIKLLPSKMEEGMELVKKWIAISSRVLGTSSRCYRPISGGSDATRTIVWETDLDSLTAFETHPKKIGADLEMQALFPKLNVIIDTIDVEFYTPIPTS